jgi:hypothetical protein
MEVVFPT